MKTLSIRHDAERMREHCIDREPFKTHGNMRADKVYPFMDSGRLPLKYKGSFEMAEYAVFSWGTPIAWYGPDGWTMPDVKYSHSTTVQQGKLSFIKDWITSC